MCFTSSPSPRHGEKKHTEQFHSSIDEYVYIYNMYRYFHFIHTSTEIMMAHSIPFTTNHYKTPKQSFGLLGMCLTMALQRTQTQCASTLREKGCTFSRTSMGHILMPLLLNRKYYSCPQGLASPFLRLNHCPWHILLLNTCTAYKPLYSRMSSIEGSWYKNAIF